MKMKMELRDDELFIDLELSRRDFDLVRLGEVADWETVRQGRIIHVNLTSPQIIKEIEDGKRKRKEENSESDAGIQGREAT